MLLPRLLQPLLNLDAQERLLSPNSPLYIVFVTWLPTTVDAVNDVFVQEAASSRYRDVMGVSADPLVSSDIIGDPHAAVVDLDLTRVVDGTLVKVMAWYDNEWGFTHQMIREAHSILGLDPHFANGDAKPGQS